MVPLLYEGQGICIQGILNYQILNPTQQHGKFGFGIYGEVWLAMLISKEKILGIKRGNIGIVEKARGQVWSKCSTEFVFCIIVK